MRRAAAAITSALALSGALAGTAAAATPESASGNVTSGAFHVAFSAQRSAGGVVRGNFDATTGLGPLTLIHVSGPVTCLDVRGNTLGLFYPITSSAPSLLAAGDLGVFFYMTVSGGQATSVSFLPVPLAHTDSCAPIPTLLPAMGSAALSP